MRHHELKVWPAHYQPKLDGVVQYDVRLNDRSYQKGDIITYREWDPDTKEYTGRTSAWGITHVDSWGMQPGFVAFGITPVQSGHKTLAERVEALEAMAHQHLLVRD